MPFKDPEKRKAYDALHKADYYQKNKERIKTYRADRYELNKEQHKTYEAQRYKNSVDHALTSIDQGYIQDLYLWRFFCNKIRRGTRKHPYPDDFTDDQIFDKMKQGCFYCCNRATTLDRVDSSLGHIQDNCVGACFPCNFSKGNCDVDSFLRKAYYRARGRYFDHDNDIWSDNKGKPSRPNARKKAIKQGVEFSLSVDEWNLLIIGDCVYCKRKLPDKRWNGVDRVIPEEGYTLENTVSCCQDCNIDKGVLTVEETLERNENIAKRIESKELVLGYCRKYLRTAVSLPNSVL